LAGALKPASSSASTAPHAPLTAMIVYCPAVKPVSTAAAAGAVAPPDEAFFFVDIWECLAGTRDLPSAVELGNAPIIHESS